MKRECGYYNRGYCTKGTQGKGPRPQMLMSCPPDTLFPIEINKQALEILEDPDSTLKACKPVAAVSPSIHRTC